MERSKYNVGRDAEKRTYDGIVFDSAMEMKYYRDVVLPQAERGTIRHYELQKPYELQPKFTHDGKTVRAITYVADFYIEYEDGSSEVIDIKGAADSVAKCKRKLFWFRYPESRYRWITYVKKYGGWIDWDLARSKRLEDKKNRESKEETKHEQDQKDDL